MAYGAVLGQTPDLSAYANGVQLQPTFVAYNDLPVGATVSLNVGGTPYDWIVVQQGTPSSLYDSSCNGTWLMMKDCYNNQVWDAGSVNSYGASDINTYLNGTFYNLLDSSVQSIVQQVKIPYVNGTGSGGNVASGANGLSCQVFLLGGYEVGWTTSNDQYIPIDGAVLSYFQDTKFIDTKRIANLNNTPIFWFLRSPYTNGITLTCGVQTSGGFSPANVSTPFGIRPVIIVQSTASSPIPTYTLTLPDGTNVASEVSEALGLPNTFTQMQIVSYVGTGTYGESNPCSITANFPIKIAIFLGQISSNTWLEPSGSQVEKNVISFLLDDNYKSGLGFRDGGGTKYSKISDDKKTIYWYNDNNGASYQLNYSGETYYFLLIG